MKECLRVVKSLSRYLDKETDSCESSLITAHLAGCPACSEELARLSLIKSGISKLTRKSLPQDYLVSRLSDKLQGERMARERFSLSGIGVLARRFIPVPVTIIALSIMLFVLNTGQLANKISFDEHILSGNAATHETVLGLMFGMVN